jgi:hypothetical protein
MAALYLFIRIMPGILPGSKRPNPVRPLEQHRYVQIIDQANGKTLTYVSVTVSVGDEYITGDNRRYVVVRLHGNKAYAKYTGEAKIGKGPADSTEGCLSLI